MTSPTASPKKIGTLMFILAWLVLIGLMILFFDDWIGQQHNPNQQPNTQQSGAIKEVILTANRQHHYVVNGAINDQEVTFLLDTGATDVVIPQHLAQQLQLPQGAKHYATTANGRVAVFATALNKLSIGNIHLQDIRASINPSMKENVILLGMSALRQIEFTQRGDTLILRQY